MMSSSPEPPFESDPQGISLEELTEAFAQVMGVVPRRTPETPPLDDAGFSVGGATPGESTPSTGETPVPLGEDDSCPINPRTIFEAMLFVGNRDNQPLSPARAAELMRDVAVEDIPPLVDELNRRYGAVGAPYRIVGEGNGYRLVLRDEYRPLRNRFFGRIREARLSQAAIDVLALVAYEQPITGEKIGRLRSKPSRHVLDHLVRRGLLRIERPEPNRHTAHYYTTERFLRLFNLESLTDLPQSDDDGPP